MNPSSSRLAQSLLMLGLLLSLPGANMAQSDSSAPIRVALKGYDTVAYFTAGKPIKGTPNVSYDWDEGRYLFSSAKHRDMFAASPERYAPQFGGLCAVGVSLGKKVEANPEHWVIVDGKLYLFSSLKAQESLQDDPGAIALAHKASRQSSR
ncbi:MAG TPA: YHS domain-containing (seleno)protein [Burkholderiaceae bacterium]|nr:YHS domain-containing (seleno)protein [Burkholderiaceae bacterium]